jgi:hypothetical protein
MRMVSRTFILPPLALGALAVLAGCPSRDVSAVDPNQSKEQQAYIPVNVNRNIDILFVVDDSGSMRQEQESLARNFPEFVRVLKSIEGGLPNIHMGVISSNVGTGGGGGGPACAGNGDNGVLQVPAGCPSLTDGARFIKDIALDEEGLERQSNYTGSLEAQFSCMAQLGTSGCGFEQHLESMRRALMNNSENAGFLRSDAFLAVIFVQDEDDCSAKSNELFDPSQTTVDSTLGEMSSYRCFEFGVACEGPSNERQTGPRQNCVPKEPSPYMENVSAYVNFLKELKGDPSKVIVAAITGGIDPVEVGINPSEESPPGGQIWLQPQCVVCEGGGTGCYPQNLGAALVDAAPAIRMHAFLDAFPQRATFQSICNYSAAQMDVDLSGALTQIAILLKQVIGNPCIAGNLTDPPQCEVADVQNFRQDNEIQFKIPACSNSGGSRPCWELIPDASCGTETNLSLEIQRDQEPPDNTTVVARCLVE